MFPGRFSSGVYWLLWMRSTSVRIGLPSLLNSDTYFVFLDHWGTLEEWRVNKSSDLISPLSVFHLLVSRISFFRFWCKILWYLWIGRARHPGPPSNNLDVEVFNVGGFLAHGDYVLDTDADFVAVVEHLLVPARARSEGKRLLHAGVLSVWAPASLEGGHVGHAGVGVVSLRGAPISMPTFATVGFSEFFHLGRALRCHLPIPGGRIIHLVVVYGFQGASTDSEKLRLTEKLLDAVLCELAVVASCQPSLIVGDLHVEPDRVPCLLKGLAAGHWFDLQSSWASASGVDPLPTCCRTFGFGGGSRRDFILGCPHAVSALRFGLQLGFRMLVSLGVLSLLRFVVFGRCMMNPCRLFLLLSGLVFVLLF